jgi:hypothetical protein
MGTVTNHECEKGTGTASVSLAVFGVPPNTSSPKERWEARHETPPHGDRAGRAPLPLRQTKVKPVLKAASSSKSMQIAYNKLLTQQTPPGPSNPVKVNQTDIKTCNDIRKSRKLHFLFIRLASRFAFAPFVG